MNQDGALGLFSLIHTNETCPVCHTCGHYLPSDTDMTNSEATFYRPHCLSATRKQQRSVVSACQ